MKRTVYGIMLVLLLTSMLTLSVIELVGARVIVEPDGPPRTDMELELIRRKTRTFFHRLMQQFQRWLRECVGKLSRISLT